MRTFNTYHLYMNYTHKQLVCEPTYAYGSTHIWCNLCDMVCHLCPLSFVILPPLPPLASSLVYPSQCLSATVVYACLLPAPCYTTPIRVARVRILSQAVEPSSSTVTVCPGLHHPQAHPLQILQNWIWNPSTKLQNYVPNHEPEFNGQDVGSIRGEQYMDGGQANC